LDSFDAGIREAKRTTYINVKGEIMNKEQMLKTAICRSCPGCINSAGLFVCTTFVEAGDTLREIDAVTECPKRNKTEIVNGFLLLQSKLGTGIKIEPEENGDGNCTLASIGSGILASEKLSELCGNEYCILPTYRIFDESGIDRTSEVLQKVAQKLSQSLPAQKMNPFGGA